MNAAQMMASTLPPPPPGEDFPSCLCAVATPWHERRVDPPAARAQETRTCLACAATLTIAWCEVVDCAGRAHWTVVPNRFGAPEYYACERHAREALYYRDDVVEDEAGERVALDDDGNIVPIEVPR